ncbi:MAG: hypothetical protein QOD69_1973 [Solirubrobacteraceae bacterium]|nr:hypothetical protein [Solirubrobacteraceae bacterium]
MRPVLALVPASVRGRSVSLAIVAGIAGGLLGGCGASHKGATAPTATSADRAAPAARTPKPPPVRLRLAGSAALPAPVQLPGLARTSDGRVLAVGGLDAADTSTSSITGVLPGAARTVGRLGQAAHDIGVASIGATVYAFGGGTAGGPIATIAAIGRDGAVRPAGRLPVAMSDTTAVTLGHVAYVIGGYTVTTPLRSVLAFRPRSGVREAAELPHPVRYAAAAAIGSRIYVAGGTTGTQARREIVEVDPATHAARTVGRLPAPLAHAAGAALGGIFYVLGGRGDDLTGQRAAIWAFDPATRRLRRAGRLPVALSDLAAVTDGDSILVAGGRDRRGGVHGERWTFRGA